MADRDEADGAARGVNAARVVKFTLVALVIGVGVLVIAAVLNPDPAALPVDYGGFD